MYVCICNAVTDSEIQKAIEDGYDDLYALGIKLGAGMSCGSCTYAVQAILDDHQKDENPVSPVSIYKP